MLLFLIGCGSSIINEQKEVLAEDVAKGFLSLVKSKKTTAHVLTVDGGNIEASLR